MITIDRPLDYLHNGETNSDIEVRAEVGLLTRNVKYQGDPKTAPQNQYGAHIMMSFEGDREAERDGNKIVGRFKYAEFQFVG